MLDILLSAETNRWWVFEKLEEVSQAVPLMQFNLSEGCQTWKSNLLFARSVYKKFWYTLVDNSVHKRNICISFLSMKTILFMRRVVHYLYIVQVKLSLYRTSLMKIIENFFPVMSCILTNWQINILFIVMYLKCL